MDSARGRSTENGSSGTPRKTVLTVAGITVAYYLLARIGLLFLVQPDGFAAFWPAAGLLPAVLLVLRKKDRAPTIAAVFISISIANLSSGMPPAISVAYAVVNCTESIAAAWVLGRITAGKVSTLGTVDFFRFLFFCTLGVCGGSSILGAAASVYLGGTPSFPSAFFLWWAADGTGMMLVTPFLLSLAPVFRSEEPILKDRIGELAVIGVVLCISTAIVFMRSTSEPLTPQAMFARPWVLLVPLTWAALRLPPSHVSFFSLLLWSFAIYFTSRGYGPYRISGIPVEASFTTLFAFLTVSYVSSYATASLLRETTEGRKREKEIDALLAETQSLSRIGGWKYDVSSRHITWTPEVYRIYGVGPDFDPSDLDRAISAYAPDSAPLIERAFRNALKSGEPYDLELELIRGTGEHILVRTIAKATLDGGKVVQVSGNIIDVSEQKRAEAERRKLEMDLEISRRRESLGTMAGGIAHQFNNLLTGVLGYIELAKESLPPASGTNELLRGAEDSARRAAELSRAMLVYVGQGVREKKRMELGGLLREHLSTLRTGIPGNVRLEIDLSPDGASVVMDPDDFRKVLSAICTNALEAIGEAEGIVRISLKTVSDTADIPGSRTATGPVVHGPWACLQVTDSGAGIDSKTIDRIFDPFFTTKFPGRGLGLPVVQGIVQYYGGAIHVHSHPGKGTTVSVLFQVADPVSPA